MPVFGRKIPDTGSAPAVPDLAASAAARGWRPLGSQPFDTNVIGEVTDVLCEFEGLIPGSDLEGTGRSPTSFTDAFGGIADGRNALVANAWIAVNTIVPFGRPDVRSLAVCLVELPVPQASIHSIKPVRTPRPRSDRFVVATGDPSFDEKFTVRVFTQRHEAEARQILHPEMRRLILARDNWAVMPFGRYFGCLRHGCFESTDDVWQIVGQALAMVAALPASVLPAGPLDHSVDDIVALIARPKSFSGALAAALALSPEQRTRFEQSGSPAYRVFGSATSPDDVMAGFRALSAPDRQQLGQQFQPYGGLKGWKP
jgi:hypothetical protein